VLPYFPFVDDTFKMLMGVTALHDRRLIEVDGERYQEEIALKQTLLADAYDEYFQAPSETESAQWDVVELLLQDMVVRYPHYFELVINGKCWTWRNRLLNDETCFILGESVSLPLPPLDWVGRQMQEDLLILSGNAADEMPLVAGQLCFPNSWCLDDKMGKSFLGMHREVPLFAHYLGRSSSLLLERLKPERPVWRVNWSLKATPRLNLTPRILSEEQQEHLMREDIGARCFLRLERQTLSRLPRTGCILFTIHTYQAPLDTVIESAEVARRIAGVVRTMPEEMQRYKGIAPFLDPLLAYLTAKDS
jgi:dimethylamine monooxygenase subunit A